MLHVSFGTATPLVPVILLSVLAVGLNTLIGLMEPKVAPWPAEIASRDR